MKIKYLILSCVFVLLACLICSCGSTNTDTQTNTQTETNTNTSTAPETNEIEYVVKAVDYNGNPISSGLFVQLYKDGNELDGMKKANASGEAKFTLEKGEYTFELVLANDDVTYDVSECVLTEKKPTKEVIVYNKLGDASLRINPYDQETGETYAYDAKFIGEGATRVDIDKMSYYVFEPTRGGMYKISYISDVALTIGYFGGSEHFVFQESTIPVVDGAFTMEIKDSSVSTQSGGTVKIIIGVKSLAVKDCLLVIERTGDAQADLQRVDYAAKEAPKAICKYNYLNHGLINLDVTNPNLKVVYNENDGYYHLGDENGEIVLVRITTAGRYLAPFTEMCETANLFAIITDEEGKPLRSEVYNSMIDAYASKCDEAGVVPLTKELEYAIKNLGEYNGWWDENSIFRSFTTDEEGNVIEGEALEVSPDIAWLFACCYVDADAKGGVDNKIIVTDTAEKKDLYVKIDTGCEIFFKSSQQIKATLTINNAQGIAVIYGENEYTADENGVIEVTFEASSPIEFSIKNISGEMKDITFNYSTYLG